MAREDISDDAWARRAAVAFRDCGAGGHDADEFDPMEVLQALTSSEERELAQGFTCPDYFMCREEREDSWSAGMTPDSILYQANWLVPPEYMRWMLEEKEQ